MRIVNSWSNNVKKGFVIYKYLDENLDFDKYEYIFIGRTCVDFKNIKFMGILDKKELSDELKKAHIFVTATQYDTCSNSLIEGMSCGLPAVALNSGGSPEIVRSGGEIFNSNDDVIEKIDLVSSNIGEYRDKIDVSYIDEIGCQYYDFMRSVYEEQN